MSTGWRPQRATQTQTVENQTPTCQTFQSWTQTLNRKLRWATNVRWAESHRNSVTLKRCLFKWINIFTVSFSIYFYLFMPILIFFLLIFAQSVVAIDISLSEHSILNLEWTHYETWVRTVWPAGWCRPLQVYKEDLPQLRKKLIGSLKRQKAPEEGLRLQFVHG